jgi:glycosyltransferase involved in cell wall biosynthesis
MNTDFSDSNKNPLFSIIIPTLNEEQYIEQCLNSIFSSDYDLAKCEVIVVDNGSTDKTCTIVTKFQDVSLHTLPSAQVGAVRNEGARYAHGNYLIFIDGDCLIDKAWLSRVEELCITNSTFVFGGAAKLPDTATWIERHWLLEKDGAPTLPRHLIGASIVIKKNVFDKTNGFNEELSSGEDTDLHSRLIESRFTIKILSDLNVVHLGNAKTIPAFLKGNFGIRKRTLLTTINH